MTESRPAPRVGRHRQRSTRLRVAKDQTDHLASLIDGEQQRQLPAHEIDRRDHFRVVWIEPLGDQRPTFISIHNPSDAHTHRPVPHTRSTRGGDRGATTVNP